MFFENRADAGQMLAGVICNSDRDLQPSEWSIVGLARGGVIIAAEIAKACGFPSVYALCIEDKRLAADKGTVTFTAHGPGMVFPTNDSPAFIEKIADADLGITHDRIAQELAREKRLNGDKELPTIQKILLCDDGLVSGQTAVTAVNFFKQRGASEIVLAVPVAPKWAEMPQDGYEIITWRITTLKNPTSGIFYFDFPQVTDQEVVNITTNPLA